MTEYKTKNRQINNFKGNKFIENNQTPLYVQQAPPITPQISPQILLFWFVEPSYAAPNAKELKNSQYFQPVPDFGMTITPLNSKFYVEFDEISGISRHFYET